MSVVLVALGDGQMTLIDQKYYLDVVYAGNWYIDNIRDYAYKYFKINNTWKKKYLHHFIVELAGITGPVDHKNLDKLDNTEENLRVANQSENLMNKGVQSNNKTGIKGVHWVKTRQKYCVQITKYYKAIHIGYFETLEEAKEAYRRASIQYHGEYGRIE